MRILRSVEPLGSPDARGFPNRLPAIIVWFSPPVRRSHPVRRTPILSKVTSKVPGLDGCGILAIHCTFRKERTMHLNQRCANCGAATTQALCAPCTQDKIIEQAQLATATAGKSIHCID